ncbi:MAG: cobaltochelatase subunit CobN [Firmicutes bacterium]|nr:cobaltochelatase subunit CobN [Bacillota bacterium]MBV1727598.1 cobaltochelatase subunit CobN [Desulforudis sp.]MBU4532843.1 cobaltochelatase subunit CobN [Bacillota bacterium]MBU4554221.1 cobaltochelatase subunit CobN [Bacillota bacterium]MBV1734405.1 cobaltochelatase subunit CobN [Desulforudis sp.]
MPGLWRRSRQKLTWILLLVLLLGAVPQGDALTAAPEEVKIVVVANSTGFFSALTAAYRKLGDQGYLFRLRIFSGEQVTGLEGEQELARELEDADVVLLQMVGMDTAAALHTVVPPLPDTVKILSTQSIEFPRLPRIDDSEDAILGEYFDQGGKENMSRLLLYLLAEHTEVEVTEDYTPVNLPENFLHHPDAGQTFGSRVEYLEWYQQSGRYREGAPWIGILTYDSFYKNDDIEMYEDLVNALEQQGANAMLVFAKDKVGAVEQFFMKGDSAAIDVLLAASGFNFVYGRPEAGVELFQKLDIPVFAPVYAGNLEDWRNNPAGLSNEVYWQIAYPELEGRIEPVLMGGADEQGVDPGTGAPVIKKVSLPDRVDRLAARALKWAELRQKPNAEKKVALVYYNYSGGKDGISASYLNVPQSLAAVLTALREDGYRAPEELPAEKLLEKMMTVGRNVGSWAPGELKSLFRQGVITVAVDDYRQWFRTLPVEMQQQVLAEWGPAPGTIMVLEDRLVIPGMVLGNVFIGPQPMRGWADDPDKITHSPNLPPTHQYLAYYFWLQREFGADAVVHLGTHGTLEWLPGRSVGLGGDDWPDVVLGDLPNIYPYIVNNPGEGTQAKRRGYAVIIDHLIPPVVRPELYGELAGLQEKLGYLDAAENRGKAERVVALQKEILARVKENNLDQVLGLDLGRDSFADVVAVLDDYLAELTTELMPYGLHTLGRAPSGAVLERMIEAMIGYDPVVRRGAADELREKLLATDRELESLLKALRGEYVSPGLGRDPVRIPDALPTGANFFSFDPRTVPDKAAWETGRQAADGLLREYREVHGRYPEKVGVVLWAIETMCTQGETVAMILRLVGAEPQWDQRGRVTGVEFTPLDELGRPRVDVVVTMSGLFRDTFANLAEMLDQTLRDTMALAESPEDNLLKRHQQQDLLYYQQQGLTPDEAHRLAGARIFSEAPGSYGTGVAAMVEATTAWEDRSELAETYLNRMGYIYGVEAYGLEGGEAFRRVLRNVEVTAQVRDSLYGVLDNDDVYQYLGGLSLAVKEAAGRDVDSFIINTRQGGAPRIQSFDRFLGTEVRTRLLNPQWIDGMLAEGYSGATEISKHVAHLFGVDATMDAVDDWTWRQTMEKLVLDPKVNSRLTPYVHQAITGWGLEAARREMWQTDREMLGRLADTYLESVLEYGVVCCHHTCANVVFNEWLAQFSSLPGGKQRKFAEIFHRATERELALGYAAERPPTVVWRLALLTETEQTGAGASAGDDSKEGQKAAAQPRAYELQTPEDGQGRSASAVNFWALLAAAGLALVLLAGYWRAKKKISDSIN